MDKFDKISDIDESIEAINRPMPDDFVVYLPWACNQFEMEYTVNVRKTYQSEYESFESDHNKSKNKSKMKSTRRNSRGDAMSDKTEDIKTTTSPPASVTEEAINIHAVFDTNEDLVEIKFHKNKFIPRNIFQVIGLILKLYPHMTCIVINQGADFSTLYELEQLLPLANITDICFDGTTLINANYETLLSHKILHGLSLSRCRIEDDGVQNIARKIKYPNPASKSLYTLNLASNKITDVGAKSLANALRSNRCLTYLNLSDNFITDDGAVDILNTLQKFCLTPEEIIESKTRRFAFLKMRNELIAKKLKELKESDVEKLARRKTARSTSTTVRKTKRVAERESLHSLGEMHANNVYSYDSTLVDKATTIVYNSLGSFDDPFVVNNRIMENDVVYCLGNNTLSCLNLSYNHLSFMCLEKIINVLSYQKQMDRKPHGLMYLCVDGNDMPATCDELKIIDTIFEFMQQRGLMNKKKPQMKPASSR